MTAHGHTLDVNAPSEAVWRIWSEPATWGQWNPDVQSVTLDGPFAAGTTEVMVNKTGRRHDIRIASVTPGRSFRLEARPIPLTRFDFTCEVEPAGEGRSRISQRVSFGGPGAILGPMMGKQVSASFPGILRALAERAEATQASS